MAALAWPGGLVALIACVGLGQAVAGYVAVRRFRAARPPAGGARPPVTVLKPLHGAEPLLEAALASLCAQDYADYQIVFGVQRADDGALAAVRRVRDRFPHREIAVVVDGTQHGANHKVGNLINMYRLARHDILVIADSDVHAGPDYLDRIVAALAVPGTGLVTTLYAGLPANRSLAAALGATGLTHSFLPGALLARWLGRQDCLGATMALRRETLSAIGGLPMLVEHIADDHVLGQLVRCRGLAVGMASAICATTVPEDTPAALFRHELRWARTIRALVPVQLALSVVQYPLFWAALAVILLGGAWWAVCLLAACWTTRALVARGIDRALGLVASGLATPAPIWLLPLRDLMSVCVILSSYAGRRVEWRSQVMYVEPDHAPSKASAT